MDEENTSIEIDKNNRKELTIIKYDKGYKSYNKVITFLINNYKRFYVKEKVSEK